MAGVVALLAASMANVVAPGTALHSVVLSHVIYTLLRGPDVKVPSAFACLLFFFHLPFP